MEHQKGNFPHKSPKITLKDEIVNVIEMVHGRQLYWLVCNEIRSSETDTTAGNIRIFLSFWSLELSDGLQMVNTDFNYNEYYIGLLLHGGRAYDITN